jgi:hypothetical protein
MKFILILMLRLFQLFFAVGVLQTIIGATNAVLNGEYIFFIQSVILSLVFLWTIVSVVPDFMRRI